MGASAREIEREIRETRERIDSSLTQLESKAAFRAVRYGRVAAVAAGVVAVGAAALIFARMRARRSGVPALVATVSTAIVERMMRQPAETAPRA